MSPLSPSSPRRVSRFTLVAVGALVASCFVAPSAEAHFILEAPESWNSQDLLGSPQKLGPCGDDGGTPTGLVTAYKQGDTVKITITETVFHPGHYRVALAVNDRSELPPEPPVTAGSTACGSTVIQDPPVFPVLADGALLHTKAFSGPQTIEVKLPPGVTCTHCTLQVIEFMSEHGLNNPGGCFYHHCADLSISAKGAAGGASGAGGSSAATAAPASNESDSGGCAVSGGRTARVGWTAFLVTLAGLLLVAKRSDG